jgi:hypothetical protein
MKAVPHSTTLSMRWSSPEHSCPLNAVGASTLHGTLGASPLPSCGSSSFLDICGMAPSGLAFASLSLPFGPSRHSSLPSLRDRSLSASAYATTASADFSLSAIGGSPFQASGETSPGNLQNLRRTIVEFTPPTLGCRSFAVIRPLAPIGVASYPLLVHRPAASFHASFSKHLTMLALRFPWIGATSSPGDSHPQALDHAGHTKKRRAPGSAP